MGQCVLGHNQGKGHEILGRARDTESSGGQGTRGPQAGTLGVLDEAVRTNEGCLPPWATEVNPYATVPIAVVRRGPGPISVFMFSICQGSGPCDITNPTPSTACGVGVYRGTSVVPRSIK